MAKTTTMTMFEDYVARIAEIPLLKGEPFFTKEQIVHAAAQLTLADAVNRATSLAFQLAARGPANDDGK